MTIKEQLEIDIKKAMLAGDKTLVTTLRGLKSAILYAEVAGGSRETGLAEKDTISILQKEAKKRQESSDMYRSGGNDAQADKEDAEKVIISEYLPKQLSEDEVKRLVDSEAAKLGEVTMQQMGQLIGAVKQASGGAADGALIAKLVKEYLG